MYILINYSIINIIYELEFLRTGVKVVKSDKAAWALPAYQVLIGVFSRKEAGVFLPKEGGAYTFSCKQGYSYPRKEGPILSRVSRGILTQGSRGLYFLV